MKRRIFGRMPPWWLTSGLGPAISMAMAGIAVMARGAVASEAERWFWIGYGLTVGGGGYAILLFLFYLRWRERTFPVRFRDFPHQTPRMTRKEIAQLLRDDWEVGHRTFLLNKGLWRWYSRASRAPKLPANFASLVPVLEAREKEEG